MKRFRPALDQYCRLVDAAPLSVTALRGVEAIERELVADALSARDLIGPVWPAAVVDVGSGNGSPGIPLAIAYGGAVTLLESGSRKARFLEQMVAALEITAPVVAERSELFARGAGRDAFDLALARALAPPPVALELCLPLVRPGGRLILWTGELEADLLAPVAAALAARLGRVQHHGGRRLIELVKLAETPQRFPRRPGMAGKRPLASLPSQG
ncbi:MAG: rRNA (guanine527-N7)-methyltransferase [Gaiellales bacterium]|nr:rRNA (guanine527-N7)-methyltransferase [Gaiellales bacterium]